MPRGGFGGGRGFGGGGGFGGRGFGGGGFGMRRVGIPLMGMGMGGGYGGSSLMGTLMAGGLGYMMGSNSAQQVAPQPTYSQYPPYPYQGAPAAPQAPTTSADSDRLAQLKLLGDLRESGTLTDDEFERQKQRLLNN